MWANVDAYISFVYTMNTNENMQAKVDVLIQEGCQTASALRPWVLVMAKDTPHSTFPADEKPQQTFIVKSDHVKLDGRHSRSASLPRGVARWQRDFDMITAHARSSFCRANESCKP